MLWLGRTCHMRNDHVFVTEIYADFKANNLSSDEWEHFFGNSINILQIFCYIHFNLEIFVTFSTSCCCMYMSNIWANLSLSSYKTHTKVFWIIHLCSWSVHEHARQPLMSIFAIETFMSMLMKPSRARAREGVTCTTTLGQDATCMTFGRPDRWFLVGIDRFTLTVLCIRFWMLLLIPFVVCVSILADIASSGTFFLGCQNSMK